LGSSFGDIPPQRRRSHRVPAGNWRCEDHAAGWGSCLLLHETEGSRVTLNCAQVAARSWGRWSS